MVWQRYWWSSNINSCICLSQDEDGLCYATLDIPLRSQRPKKKRVQPSEFSTYSAINTKRLWPWPSLWIQTQGLYFLNMTSSLCCQEEEEYHFPLQSQENANISESKAGITFSLCLLSTFLDIVCCHGLLCIKIAWRARAPCAFMKNVDFFTHKKGGCSEKRCWVQRVFSGLTHAVSYALSSWATIKK